MYEYLKKIGYKGVPIFRLSATLNKKNGHLGCADSHIRALKLAKKEGLQNVIIMEDDFS